MLFVVYNYNFITKFVLLLCVFIFFQIVKKPTMSNNLSTDKRIWMLKEDWKSCVNHEGKQFEHLR